MAAIATVGASGAPGPQLAPLAPAAPLAASSAAAYHHQDQQPASTLASPGLLAENQEHSHHDNCSVSSTSLPQFSADRCNSIPEESDEDSEILSHNEPLTPVSGRQSPVFPTISNRDHDSNGLVPFPAISNETAKADLGAPQGPFLNTNFQFPSENTSPEPQTTPQEPAVVSSPSTARTSTDQAESVATQNRRRSTHGSVGFKRTMSSLFSRKPTSADDQQDIMVVAQQNGAEAPRRWSMARSSGTTPLSTMPPSPSASTNQEKPSLALPEPSKEPLSKKNRASTGLSFRNRVNFSLGNKAHTNNKPDRRRASSFESKRPDLKINEETPGPGQPLHARQVFYAVAEAGVGVKARRLSLSLPDDIVIDVGILTDEYEYQHKFFGRHRDSLGKGATASVKIMAKKGFVGELYAVKEFRGKTSAESKEEYEKKVKSEYSIAKSLHHPNIIETVRLCIDHGRWNHVMEYCSEGDLFGLVKKRYLSKPERMPDRLCLFKQLIQGLNYLHSNGIAHRDIKLENLLVTKDSKLKITDFGVSEVFSGIHPGVRESGGECGRQMGDIRLCNPGVCGSEPYIAPEVLAKDRKYDPRSLDVWGAGIVLIVLICGSTLWQKAKPDAPNSEHYNALVKSFEKWNAKKPEGPRPMTESDYPAYFIFDNFVNPPALRRILLMMLNPNPDHRATISQILNHRWVKNIDCCQIESYDDPALIIDATKSASVGSKGSKKIFCHNHLPPQVHNTHSLGKMPGQAGY
ncbi:kinase-like domain-containing protein [Coniella lustricola]|uniref:non-specific serine/threonine protein kinase n=1 Tax=Coniella lustricola TaxID=2025994 RepID=A0A2T3ALM5_9PEZI|nr:kinase-like domain-containing protein [Coniella lustricola]